MYIYITQLVGDISPVPVIQTPLLYIMVLEDLSLYFCHWATGYLDMKNHQDAFQLFRQS